MIKVDISVFAFKLFTSALYFYILRYVKAKIIVDVFIIELDQLHYRSPSKMKVSGEVFSCGITDSDRDIVTL